MKSIKFILAAAVAFGFTATAHADRVPTRSKDFTGNYQTLIKDQQASPQVADCVAAAYDFVKKDKKYDQLGFTKDDLASANISQKATKFSAKDPRKVSSVLTVPGEARIKATGYQWDGINLRCGISNGKLTAIEFVKTKAAQ
ncbi:type IV secretion system effector BspC [Brucellaceae bacterium D45D]